MYALFERIDKNHIPGKRRLLITRFEVPSDISENKTSIRRPVPVVHQTNKSKDDIDDNNYEVEINNDNILFVYLDELNRDVIGPIRAVNNDLQIFSNSTSCLNYLQYSNEKIFLISSLNDKEFLKKVQDCLAVEAIFIYKSEGSIDRNRFSKLIGIYKHSEELIIALKNALEWFEQTQLNFFTFEREQIFLWLQMWKEFIKPTNPQVLSNKEKFVTKAEKYYRGNTRFLKSLDEFDYCYERNDALQWCFSSPFPSHFIYHALRTRNTKYINLCRFLINDVSRVLQQPMDFKANRQFFRGLKVTNEELEKLMKHTGKLICPKGYFTCNKSRKVALNFARTADYRLDLRPVLFKINCPSSVPIGELPMTGTAGIVVFDVYTAFRVKCVNRGPVSIVKLEPADADGRNLARAYRMKYKSENVQNLLEQLSAIPKPPAKLPPLPPVVKTPRVAPKKVSSAPPSKDEIHARRLVERGQVDQALTVYERLKTRSPRVLKTMGQLYADRKGDYNSAVKYYKEAIKIQETNGDDPSETLNQLAITHHNRREFDLALEYHNRALSLQTNKNQDNQSDVAGSLIGIANAQWGQGNLSEAYQSAQKALALNESSESGNDLNLAMNLAVLANIHHKAGDDTQALNFIQRALAIVERCVPADSLTLASILNNMGSIQMGLGLFPNAEHSFDRALKICEKILPPGHPKRTTMEMNIQRNKEIMKNETNSP